MQIKLTHKGLICKTSHYLLTREQLNKNKSGLTKKTSLHDAGN